MTAFLFGALSMQPSYYARLVADASSSPSISPTSSLITTPESNSSCTPTTCTVLLTPTNPFRTPPSNTHTFTFPTPLSQTDIFPLVGIEFPITRCWWWFRMFGVLFLRFDRTFFFLFPEPYFNLGVFRWRFIQQDSPPIFLLVCVSLFVYLPAST